MDRMRSPHVERKAMTIPFTIAIAIFCILGLLFWNLILAPRDHDL